MLAGRALAFEIFAHGRRCGREAPAAEPPRAESSRSLRREARGAAHCVVKLAEPLVRPGLETVSVTAPGLPAWLCTTARP